MGGWVEKRAGLRQEAGETDGSRQNGSKNQPQSRFDEVLAQSLAFKAQIATNPCQRTERRTRPDCSGRLG